MIEFIKKNPVVILDLAKYVLAALVLFGVPIPDGLDAIIAGVILAGLSLLTQTLVQANVQDALYTPVPKVRATTPPTGDFD